MQKARVPSCAGGSEGGSFATATQSPVPASVMSLRGLPSSPFGLMPAVRLTLQVPVQIGGLIARCVHLWVIRRSLRRLRPVTARPGPKPSVCAGGLNRCNLFRLGERSGAAGAGGADARDRRGAGSMRGRPAAPQSVGVGSPVLLSSGKDLPARAFCFVPARQ